MFIIKLLGLGYIPNEIAMTLLRPWYRANMLATWHNQVSWDGEKERAKTLVKTIKSLKKQLNHGLQDIITRMLFMTSSEPDTERFISSLDELQQFLEVFINSSFKNGSEYSPQYFIRYAIDSLFYIGKKIGLKESGSPTQLNKYVHIVTGRVYVEINKDYMKFKKLDFLENFNKKKNIPLLFIFDPYRHID